MRAPPRRTGALLVGLTLACVSMAPQRAAAQSLNDVLSFLLTNRSIPTGDFVRDEEAAAATRDAISALLVTELGTLPSGSSSGGFTYRLDPALGASIRSSDSFGPFFTERALTAGTGEMSFGITYQRSVFQDIDGRNLRDGTLVATASKLRTDTQFFDVETLSLRLSTDAVTMHSNIGVTDRLDLGAALPLIRVTLSGERIDTYRGTRTLQATASGSSSGPGDIIFRAKYNVLRQAGRGFSLGAEASLPTGDKRNLRGTGDTTIAPRAILSLEHERTAVHGNFGYVFGSRAEKLAYNGAVTYAVTPRLTLVGELAGRRLTSVGRLTEVTVPHPRLIDVDTVRLTGTDDATNHVVTLAGLKWNVRSSWLLSLNLLRPLTQAGLNTRWTPTITLERSFEP